MIDLCTLADVKLLAEITSTDFDADLNSRITTVSHNLQVALNIDLELQSFVEYHTGGKKRIYVRNPPIISVTSIVLSTSFDFASGETIAASDYLLTNNNWDITHVNCWPGRDSSLKVTYTSGYADASTVPQPIRQAVAKQVVFDFQHRKSTGLMTVELADGSITKEENNLFLKSVDQIKKLYRKVKIG